MSGARPTTIGSRRSRRIRMLRSSTRSRPATRCRVAVTDATCRASSSASHPTKGGRGAAIVPLSLPRHHERAVRPDHRGGRRGHRPCRLAAGLFAGCRVLAVERSRQDVDGPVPMPVAWSDKPQLAVSADGQDMYVDMNGPSHGDSRVAVSHDGGESFSLVRVTDDERYNFAGGAWTSADGQHVAFAQTSYDQHYRGRIHSDLALSDDGGATWRSVRVATGDRQPDCTSDGCLDGYYGPTPALAGDPTATSSTSTPRTTRREPRNGSS